MSGCIDEHLGKKMKVCLTKEETELIVLAGLLADESPFPLLSQEIERCTVAIEDNGVTIEIIYKKGDENGAGIH